jgi:ribosome-binding factor A
MTHRNEQLNATLQRLIGQVITEGLSDPRIRGIVSVTGVKVSPDLHEAQVHVSVMPAEHGPLAVEGLRHAARHIQTRIGEHVRMRKVPRLDFRLDDSLKRQAQVLAAIRDAMQDEQTQEDDPGDDEQSQASGREPQS